MPSVAALPVRLAASARPRSRRIRLAASMWPPASWSAFLQSIIPAPVASRRVFTSRALTSAMSCLSDLRVFRGSFRTSPRPAPPAGPGQQRPRANGIVVAGDAEVDLLGIAVGVEHGDDRDPELARLAHRDLLLAGIEDVDRVR